MKKPHIPASERAIFSIDFSELSFFPGEHDRLCEAEGKLSADTIFKPATLHGWACVCALCSDYDVRAVDADFSCNRNERLKAYGKTGDNPSHHLRVF